MLAGGCVGGGRDGGREGVGECGREWVKRTVAAAAVGHIAANILGRRIVAGRVRRSALRTARIPAAGRSVAADRLAGCRSAAPAGLGSCRIGTVGGRGLTFFIFGLEMEELGMSIKILVYVVFLDRGKW